MLTRLEQGRTGENLADAWDLANADWFTDDGQEMSEAEGLMQCNAVSAAAACGSALHCTVRQGYTPTGFWRCGYERYKIKKDTRG
jgi:hypothetical protein